MSRPSKEEAEQRRQERVQAAKEAIETLSQEKSWATWLTLRKGLYRFSWRNQVLIAIQCAERGIEPTLVQSATRWKKAGYHPEKGSSALYVWAYRSRRGKPKPGSTQGWWKCCGMALLAQQVCPTCRREDHYFTMAPEFDASQVVSFETGEHPARPEGAKPIEGAELAERIDPFCAWLVYRDSSPVAQVQCIPRREDPNLADGAAGYWDQAESRIVVCADLAPNHQLAVLVHEAAHALGVSSKADDGLSYAEAEVLAECVAYVVCAAIGLDTSAQAIPYMTGWANADTSVMARRAQLINDAASTLEAALITEETHVPAAA